ncbi:DNA methyltransferase [Bifidobacterium primatium]|uniref:site-specific DNA-methyltransferase (adenine-specific) n=2 Tax=Bifidobacterium TaxID=1678 RepID=A0A2M9H9M4_9BIFI|nr:MULTISPECIES: class I SAM-dependent DNA methyltransferase [Bifidobacterium]NEG96731.1 N-6 DNA methylase [Bifidobacterium sp. SMB2]NEH11887.1 N-6 DNA methylase [Bifidobacterium saimiriisciurei]PJM73518.1 DNA methyltransferase [Bifidobacterium primatium]
MITGAVKNKVDDIWQRMWEGGVTNPVEVISQLTYLMFMKSLDDKALAAERMAELTGVPVPDPIFPQTPEGQAVRWHNFKDASTSEEMFAIVGQQAFPFIRNLHADNAFAHSMEDAQFGFNKPKTLEKAVKGIDDLLDNYVKDQDDLGDLYEYMLSKLNTAGANGQFRTPKHIRDMMVALVDPQPGQKICDPACGTAGFLISAAEWIRSHYESEMTSDDWDLFDGPQFTGFDTDQTMVRISSMNLLLHGVENPDVRNQDSLSRLNTISSKFSCILANPPFTGSLDAEDVDDSLKTIITTKQTELLFVVLFLRMLRLGGRCACIVPNGVLFRSNAKAYRELRRELVENQCLEAIIYMPSGVFKPYSGVSTAVLVFTKTDAPDSTDRVWLYNMEHDGYTLDDKRDEDPDHNDIPDIIERWNDLDAEESRERTEKSFFITRDDIVKNDYDFSFNKYVKVECEKKEYPPTSELMADLHDLNARFVNGLNDLDTMLAKDGE